MSDDISVKKFDNFIINDNEIVSVLNMGHIVEVKYLEKKNRCQTIQKLNSDEYVLLVGDEQGVIKKFNHTTVRSENFKSIRKTFNKLRLLINNNFFGGDNELFVTLTYAENMTDVKRLYFDCDKFFKKLKYFYNNQGITFDYLSVIEPQGRGAWHCHILFKFSDKIFIDNQFLRDKWGQGFVNVHRLQQCDNIGAYLTAYLADFVVDDNVDIGVLSNALNSSYGVIERDVDVNGVKVSKRIIKGGRLCFYPSGVNIYRKSKGIKMPDEIFMSFGDCKKNIVGNAVPNYTTGIEILKAAEHLNSICYQQYNLKR